MALGSLQDVNAKLFSGINLSGILKGVGWIIVVLLVVGGGAYLYYIWNQRKVWGKKITVFEIVGSNFSPIFRDTAKVVKLGKGGFEVLYLKKYKTYRLGYGGRIGKDTYYYFIMPDGYWYNGMMGTDIHTIDKNGGLIPIVTTNASMRAQYTALEKQIDSLHSQKKGFLEQYGSWVASIAFIVVAGVMFYLMFREVGPIASNLGAVADKMGVLVDKVNILLGNAQGIQPSNLVPVG